MTAPSMWAPTSTKRDSLTVISRSKGHEQVIPARIAVIGAGAWGTALALHGARLGADVSLWARHPDRIHGENPRLPGFVLPDSVAISGQLPGPANLTLLAVPVAHLREILCMLSPSGPLLLCCKGLEPRTLRLPLEISAGVHPGIPACVLTGPNFAREIAAGKPGAAVIAGGDAELRQTLIGLLGSPGFRLYGNDDAVGAQIGGAAKNVVAIAAGAVIGAGLGENARAALITRGLAEMARLAVALGGRAETTAGLSGLGDLVLTCTSTASRNYSLGAALGRGQKLSELLTPDGPVVEGVAAAAALLARAPDLDMPICRAVADLLAGRLDVAAAAESLLARPYRNE